MSRECPFGAVWRVFGCQDAFGPRDHARDLPSGKVKFCAELIVGPAVNPAPAQELPVPLAMDRLCNPPVDFCVRVLHRVLLP